MAYATGSRASGTARKSRTGAPSADDPIIAKRTVRRGTANTPARGPATATNATATSRSTCPIGTYRSGVTSLTAANVLSTANAAAHAPSVWTGY